MSWQTEMVTMIRHLIDDLDTPQTYSDSRLQELILITGQQVQQQVSFMYTYSFNISALTLTPDPSDGVRDEAFMWLVTLKSCCILTSAEAKKAAANAIDVRDAALVQVDAREIAKAKKAIADKFCKDFEDSRWMFQMSNRPSGQGLFSPFGVITGAVYGNSGGFGGYSTRERPLFS